MIDIHWCSKCWTIHRGIFNCEEAKVESDKMQEEIMNMEKDCNRTAKEKEE